MNKISQIWEHILVQHKYNNTSTSFIISAEQIKECKKSWTGVNCQFEPRLLCYQTNDKSRPDIFKKNNLYILPIKNGEYLLSKNNIYKTLEYTDIQIIEIKKDTSSLLLDIGNSETSVIDNLRYSGVFESEHFLDEKITHGPLLNGRHYCNIDMKLGLSEISVRGVQYEVDCCFESEHKILLIEGKSSNKIIDDFNIRQLYYPYRVIYEKIKNKEIICLFIHKLDDIINIWKYTFSEFDRIDSITCTGHYRYSYVK